MTVEELRRELDLMPPTAVIVARIRHNVAYEGGLTDLYEFRDAPIDGAVYDRGEVYLSLDENG